MSDVVEYGGFELIYDPTMGSVTLYELNPEAKNPKKEGNIVVGFR